MKNVVGNSQIKHGRKIALISSILAATFLNSDAWAVKNATTEETTIDYAAAFINIHKNTSINNINNNDVLSYVSNIFDIKLNNTKASESEQLKPILSQLQSQHFQIIATAFAEETKNLKNIKTIEEYDQRHHKFTFEIFDNIKDVTETWLKSQATPASKKISKNTKSLFTAIKQYQDVTGDKYLDFLDELISNCKSFNNSAEKASDRKLTIKKFATLNEYQTKIILQKLNLSEDQIVKFSTLRRASLKSYDQEESKNNFELLKARIGSNDEVDQADEYLNMLQEEIQKNPNKSVEQIMKEIQEAINKNSKDENTNNNTTPPPKPAKSEDDGKEPETSSTSSKDEQKAEPKASPTSDSKVPTPHTTSPSPEKKAADELPQAASGAVPTSATSPKLEDIPKTAGETHKYGIDELPPLPASPLAAVETKAEKKLKQQLEEQRRQEEQQRQQQEEQRGQEEQRQQEKQRRQEEQQRQQQEEQRKQTDVEFNRFLDKLDDEIEQIPEASEEITLQQEVEWQKRKIASQKKKQLEDNNEDVKEEKQNDANSSASSTATNVTTEAQLTVAGDMPAPQPVLGLNQSVKDGATAVGNAATAAIDNLSEISTIEIASRISDLTAATTLARFTPIGTNAGGTSSGDGFTQPVNLWVKGFFSQGKQTATVDSPGFKTKHAGGVIGIDTMFNDSNIIGIAYSHTNLNATFSGKATKSEMKAHVLTGYLATYITDAVFLNSQLKYGMIKIKNSGNSKMNTKGALWGIREELGYEIKMENGLLLVPTIGLAYDEIKLNNFRDKGTREDVEVSSKKNKRLNALAGINLAKVLDMGSYSLVPNIHIGIERALELKNQAIKVTALDESADTAILPQKKIGKNTLIVGGGIKLINTNKFEIGIGYDMIKRDKFRSHTGSIKMRVNF
jgi:hypothetical protein